MIVLMSLVVIAFVVLALLVFFFPVVLCTSSSHHGNRCSKDGSQKNRAEKSVSTLHVVPLSARFKSANPTHITFYLWRRRCLINTAQLVEENSGKLEAAGNELLFGSSRACCQTFRTD